MKHQRRMTRNNLSPNSSFPYIFSLFKFQQPSYTTAPHLSTYVCIFIYIFELSRMQIPIFSNLKFPQQSKMSTSQLVEITIISCEELTTSSSKAPIRKNARAVIRMHHCSKSHSTTLDVKGGAYPCWNEKFTVEMPATMRWFDVEIWCRMEKLIGKARIPATDFVGGILPDGYLNFLSYRLREQNGEFNGIVNVSVRVAGGKGRSKEESDRLGFGCGYAIGVPTGTVVTGNPVFSATKA